MYTTGSEECMILWMSLVLVINLQVKLLLTPKHVNIFVGKRSIEGGWSNAAICSKRHCADLTNRSRRGVNSSRGREGYDSSGGALHGVVIAEGTLSLAVLQSHNDTYVLYKPLMLDDPPVCKIGKVVGQFILWPVEYLRRCQEKCALSGKRRASILW